MADKQAVVELRDWRSDSSVLVAQRERDSAASRVGEMEAEHRKLAATVAAAERDVEQVTARLRRAECTLSELSRAKSALSSARAAAVAVEQRAEDAYRTYTTAEQRYRDAAIDAQRAAWPADAQRYVAAVRRLGVALDAAMAAEQETLTLHKQLTERYPLSRDGWVVGPDNVRLGCGSFGRTRRLVAVSLSNWHTWVTENIFDVAEPAAQLRKRARAAGDALRAMVGA